MSSRLSTGRIATACARRPWLTVGIWTALIVVAGVVASGIADVLTTEIQFANRPESVRASDALEDSRGPEPLLELVAVGSNRFTVEDPEFSAFVAPILAAIRALDGHVVPAATTSYFEYPIPDLVAGDGQTTLIPVTLVGELDDADEHVTALKGVLASFDDPDFELVVGGQASINLEFTEVAQEDLASESKVLPFALLVLVLVFGTVVAALLPLGLAFVAIAMAVAGATLIGSFFSLSIFVTNMIFTVGLAVGIDYALFIVARYREERRRGSDKVDAIRTSGYTAARAVAFSGMTVVIALLGMLIVPTTVYRSLAAGAILAVMASVAITTTLLPAVLSLLGDRIDRLALPFLSRRRRAMESEDGFWARTARLVMRHPITSLVASAGLLLALAIPYLDIRLGSAGAGTLPVGTDAARAFEILDEDFEVGRLAPVEIVVLAGDVGDPRIAAATASLESLMAPDAMFGDVSVQLLDAGTALLSAPLDADAGSDAATQAVDRLREGYIPTAFAGVDADVLVGGLPALNRDWFSLVDTYTPIVFVFVLGLSFLLLLVMFRSIVVPLKAILMNLLSVGAAYGLLVLVFQKGVGAGLLGFQQVEAVEAWVPLFLFTVLFGLSMDYHVFLLSRIREHFDETQDNTDSVAFGIRTTARIITGAAAIMVVVFGGFALGELVMFQQMGFGLAVAIFLDATVVRTILVPSTMRLLGKRNWYLPSWLGWLPQVRLEEHLAVGAGSRPDGDGTAHRRLH